MLGKTLAPFHFGNDQEDRAYKKFEAGSFHIFLQDTSRMMACLYQDSMFPEDMQCMDFRVSEHIFR